MKYQENWAVPVTRIREFFSREFQVDSWEEKAERAAEDSARSEYHARIHATKIILRPLPDSLLMKAPIRRTEIEIEGPDEEAENIHHRFLMNFLSAGG